MPLVNDIVGWINARVCNIIPGVKAYGIAKSALKDGKQLPYTGDKYIGVDDVYEAQVYHKLLTLSTNSVPNSGYGDNEFSIQNTYGMAMVIYYDENKAGQPDQLYAFIQSAITGALKAEDYKSIRVNVISAILNDGQVWASEYGQTPLKLMGSQRLIQVNYSIVAVFDKQCISLPNCKN
jgi:hypothetical protein